MEQSQIARIHGEQGILKTVQCTVLPCEVSERNRSRDAVTENGVFIAPSETRSQFMNA